jgi:hypothetical protein
VLRHTVTAQTMNNHVDAIVILNSRTFSVIKRGSNDVHLMTVADQSPG